MPSAYPTAFDSAATLLTPVDANALHPLETTLAAMCLDGDTTLQLASTSVGFAAAYGVVSIDNEIVIYTAISGSTLTGCERGAFGTTRIGHAAGAAVRALMVAGYLTRLQEAVIATQGALGIDGAYNFGALNGDLALDGGVTRVSSLRGNALSAAAPTTGQVLRWSGTSWAPATAAGGGVSSVGLSMPSIFSVASSPVTGSGSIAVTLATQAANKALMGPVSGSPATPTFRTIAAADLPSTVVYANSSTYAISIAGSAGSVAWANVSGKPTNFVYSDSSTYAISISGNAATATLAAAASSVTWANVSAKPAVATLGPGGELLLPSGNRSKIHYYGDGTGGLLGIHGSDAIAYLFLFNNDGSLPARATLNIGAYGIYQTEPIDLVVSGNISAVSSLYLANVWCPTGSFLKLGTQGIVESAAPSWTYLGNKPGWLASSALTAHQASYNTFLPSGFYDGDAVTGAPEGLAGWSGLLRSAYDGAAPGDNWGWDIAIADWMAAVPRLYARTTYPSTFGDWYRILVEDGGTYNINITGTASTTSASIAWANVTGKPANLVFADGGTYNINITGTASTTSASIAWSSISGKPTNFVYADSGAYAISVTGSAGSVAWAYVSGRPGWLANGSLALAVASYDADLPSGFYSGHAVTGAPEAMSTFSSLLRAAWSPDGAGCNWGWDMAVADWQNAVPRLYTRCTYATTFGAWYRIVVADSGTYAVNISGNAATASAIAWASVTGKPTDLVHADGAVYAIGISGNAATASAVAWSAVTGKPDVVTTANFTWANLGGIPGDLVYSRGGTYGINISGSAASADSVAWTDVSGKPDLSDYATVVALNNAISAVEAEIPNLESYVTTTTLTEQLGLFVTYDNLSSILDGYVTTAGFAGLVANYPGLKGPQGEAGPAGPPGETQNLTGYATQAWVEANFAPR